MGEAEEWQEAEEELETLAEQEYPKIHCDTFPYIQLIKELLYIKLENETNERLKQSMEETFECIPIYFRYHKINPAKREHYENRVGIHIGEICNYLQGKYVKPRLLKSELKSNFPIY